MGRHCSACAGVRLDRVPVCPDNTTKSFGEIYYQQIEYMNKTKRINKTNFIIILIKNQAQSRP
jgi:hypothetical protein